MKRAEEILITIWKKTTSIFTKELGTSCHLHIYLQKFQLFEVDTKSFSTKRKSIWRGLGLVFSRSLWEWKISYCKEFQYLRIGYNFFFYHNQFFEYQLLSIPSAFSGYNYVIAPRHSPRVYIFADPNSIRLPTHV